MGEAVVGWIWMYFGVFERMCRPWNYCFVIIRHKMKIPPNKSPEPNKKAALSSLLCNKNLGLLKLMLPRWIAGIT
jgi:hypothetical protein